MKLSCLIPAWNEAARLPGVLAALRGHPLIDRLMVIDDASTDDTDVTARAEGAEVLRLPVNGGKTRALAAGIATLTGDWVMLIDADLQGLTAADITRLAEPVRAGRAQASLSLRGNAPAPWRWLGVDYLSGERVLPLDLLKSALPCLPGLPRFGFEVFVNRQMRERGLAVAVVNWPGVTSPTKAAKQGLRAGLRADAGMIADILRCQPAGELARQILWLRRGADQIERQNRQCSASAAAVRPTTSPSQTPTPFQPTTNPSP